MAAGNDTLNGLRHPALRISDPTPQPILKARSSFLFCVLLGLPACAPIRHVETDVQSIMAWRHEKALRADMDRIGKDTRHAYRLDYVVSNEWMPSVLTALPRFRALPDRQFDMTSWLQANGAEANSSASAVFDSDQRKIVIIDTGHNVALAEKLLEPMRPSQYARVKTPPPAAKP